LIAREEEKEKRRKKKKEITKDFHMFH